MRRIGLIVGLFLVIVGLGSRDATAQSPKRCFDVPLISACIEGRFLEFWEAQGGLPVFGYPITDAFMQVNEDTGQVYLTQYFERQRFELHPELAAPYDVSLGRLGAIKLDFHIPNWREEDARATIQPGPHRPHYIPETHRNIGTHMYDYWSSHGLEFDGQTGTSRTESVALFGFPLRQEYGSSQESYTWQNFERTILEWHFELPGQPVLGDRLGVWYIQIKCDGRMGGREGLFDDATCARVNAIAYP